MLRMTALRQKPPVDAWYMISVISLEGVRRAAACRTRADEYARLVPLPRCGPASTVDNKFYVRGGESAKAFEEVEAIDP
jgi:hypothetical protein